MIYRIRCAFQTSEGFDRQRCFACPKFSVNLGKPTVCHCEMQKTPREKWSFDGAMHLWIRVKRPGIRPIPVEVVKDGR